MTQPFNFTPKAVEHLLNLPCEGAPLTRLGMRYIANKLREAQVFVLSDAGQLLDRAKPRPEVPGVVFKPSFPVVALEYMASGDDWGGVYTEVRSSKRIALAWEYTGDLPSPLNQMISDDIRPGVTVASICWYDEMRTWMPVAAAAHIPYDGAWERGAPMPFIEAMRACGRISHSVANAKTFEAAAFPLLPEVLLAIGRERGGQAGALDTVMADLSDEVAAYTDLCYALACKNVSTQHHAASAPLNKQRLKAGKLPLKDFHILELSGAGTMPGGAGVDDRAAARSHLRRGHIRRLDGDRVTWVNATIVRGRGQGFAEKAYAI